MILHVTRVKYIRDYVVRVQFNDGVEGEVDLEAELDGPVFGPLRDRQVFKNVRADPLLRTIAWPNDADLAPEYLYERVTGKRVEFETNEALAGLTGKKRVRSAEHAATVCEKSPTYRASLKGPREPSRKAK